MSETLANRIAAALERPVDAAVAAYARRLGEEAGAQAVLFYGSNLRTGSLDGVLDFYVLLPGDQREAIWPRVSYREWDHAGVRLRAKIATLSLQQFAQAANGGSRDTTIWARFVQPSALVWQASEEARAEVTQALCAAAVTAGRLAAVVGPARGTANDYWRALFRATYKAEFRVEKPGRENSILEVNAEHFDGLLPIAWNAGGMRFKRMNGLFEPLPNSAERRRVLKWWSRRARLGKPLNLLRLAKATTTFDGAADYAAWKLQRHTGIALEVTPFRARHPLLAAPGALVELWRKRRA